MKLVILSVVLLNLMTGCVSRYGTANEDQHEVQSAEKLESSEGKTGKFFKKADYKKYSYVDTRIGSELFDRSEYNRIKSHNFVDYYSKKISMKQAVKIKKYFEHGAMSSDESVELVKTKDKVDFYLYKIVVEEGE